MLDSMDVNTICISVSELEIDYLPIILGRPFLLSEEGIVFPLTGPFTEWPTLSLKPFGGRSLIRF